MARIKGSGRKGAVAPVASDAGQGANSAGKHDALRPSGDGGAAEKAGGAAKDWKQVSARLRELETPANPICIVYWPEPVGDLWGGVYGNAKIHEGEPLAVLSSGEQIAL